MLYVDIANMPTTKNIGLEHFFSIADFWMNEALEGVLAPLTTRNADGKVVDYQWLFENHTIVQTGFALPVDGALHILTNRDEIRESTVNPRMFIHHTHDSTDIERILEAETHLIQDAPYYASYQDGSGTYGLPYTFVMDYRTNLLWIIV